MNHGSCSSKLNIKPTKDEITPPNVTTVADEEGTDRQTDKLCFTDVANEFKKKLWQLHSVWSAVKPGFH